MALLEGVVSTGQVAPSQLGRHVTVCAAAIGFALLFAQVCVCINIIYGIITPLLYTFMYYFTGGVPTTILVVG